MQLLKHYQSIGKTHAQGLQTLVVLQVMKALLHTKEKQDPRGWQAFQKQVNTLKLQRTRMQRELEELQGALFSATQQLEADVDDEAGEP